MSEEKPEEEKDPWTATWCPMTGHYCMGERCVCFSMRHSVSAIGERRPYCTHFGVFLNQRLKPGVVK